MIKLTSKVLMFLSWSAILGISACSTTTQRLGPNQAALANHGVTKGDMILVRYANKNDPRSSSRSELVEITDITASGIAGTGENGREVYVAYNDIFQIEYKKLSYKRPGEMPKVGSAFKVASAMIMALGESPGN